MTYTCRKCHVVREFELTEEQQQALVAVGVGKLRPNVCPDCDGRVYELTQKDKDLCARVAAYQDKQYREQLEHWEAMRQADRKTHTGHWSTAQLRGMSMWENLKLYTKAVRGGVQQHQPQREDRW